MSLYTFGVACLLSAVASDPAYACQPVAFGAAPTAVADRTVQAETEGVDPPALITIVEPLRTPGATVTLRLLVNELGFATEARVHHSSGNALRDNEALSVYRHQCFNPGIRNGKPVHVWIAITVPSL